jgi:hypothetical protein
MKIVSALSKPAIRALIGDNREQLIRLAVRSPIRRVSAAARPDLDDLDPTSCHQGPRDYSNFSRAARARGSADGEISVTCVTAVEVLDAKNSYYG